MIHNVEQLRARIANSLKDISPEHTDKGHFYRINTPNKDGISGLIYPSVTGKIQIIKDEGLINYKKNRALDYMYKHFKEFTDENIEEHLKLADRVPEDILTEAGDIGRDVHDIREVIFKNIIAGKHVDDFLSFIPPSKPDVRIRSAIRALSAFCRDYKYIPIVTESFVYSHKLKVAGTLDDIGLITKTVREGTPGCVHEVTYNNNNESICLKCGFKEKQFLVLMDLKTSNQFKDHYFFQVALYYQMFVALTDIRPEICFILKVSKEDGTYKIEELKNITKLAMYARSMLKTNEGISFIKSVRKDNQKIVGEKIEL